MGMIRKRIIFFAFSVALFLNGEATSQVKIGLALPLAYDEQGKSGNPVGEQMLKGITDALREHETVDTSALISLVVEDTKRVPETALEVINKFGSDRSIIGVIGPVFSSELSVTAGAGNFHKMPVISPTATVNFAAKENPYLFQLNPTYDIRGKLIARYAHRELGMRRFIILAEDAYGKEYANAFQSEANINEDSILLVVTYKRDDWDLADEVGSVRKFLEDHDRFVDFSGLQDEQTEMLMKAGLSKSAIDTLSQGRYLVSVYRLFGDGLANSLMAGGLRTVGYDPKVFNVVFGLADAIYIPVSQPSEIEKISFELYKSRLGLPVLGTSDWNTDALKQASGYIEHLWIESDFVLGEKFTDKAALIKPEGRRNYFFGYGTAKLLFELIAAGNNTRETLNNALENITGKQLPYNGLTVKDRTNSSLNVLKLEKGNAGVSGYSY